MTSSLQQRVVEAMRSDEWLRTQWIMRVVYDLGKTPIKDVPGWSQKVAAVLGVLRRLEGQGRVERRDATERKPYGPIPRDEWRKL